MAEIFRLKKIILYFIFYCFKQTLSQKGKRLVLIACFFISLFFISTANSQAAILSLESAEEEYYREDIFVAEVKLDTEEERINALQVELTFPPDKLEVIDVSRGDSVLTLWPEEPVFFNQEGKISFIGGVPLGFEGQGKIVSISFRVISSQESQTLVEIIFQDSSRALLNDGLGTDAFLSFQKTVFTIFPEEAEVPRDEWQEELAKDDILPEPFKIMLARHPLIFEGKYFIAFFTVDSGAGISHYQVKEGDRPWKKTGNFYLLEDQGLQSLIKVKAVDKAGNQRIAELRHF